MKSPIGQGLANGLQAPTEYCPIFHSQGVAWRSPGDGDPGEFLSRALRIRAEGKEGWSSGVDTQRIGDFCSSGWGKEGI